MTQSIIALGRLIKKKHFVLGMENWLRDARVVELLGYAGFDFLHIENEHVGRNWNEVENMIRTAELMGMASLYRTEQCFDGEPPVNEIIKAVKLGAQIIMVPQVSTPEAARKAASAIRLPPRGKRGIATCDRSMKEIYPTPETPLDIDVYCKESNDEVMLWCIIETPEGVKNIDAILAVDGVDAVGFGHSENCVHRFCARSVFAAKRPVLRPGRHDLHDRQRHSAWRNSRGKRPYGRL